MAEPDGAAKSTRRILVVQSAFLGDLILTLPLFAELGRRYPEARITAVVRAGLEEPMRTQGFHEVLPLRKTGRRPGREKGFGGAAQSSRIMRRLRASGPFDLGIAAQRSHRGGLLLLAAGCRRRVGFADAPGRWAYNRLVERRTEDHAVLRYLALAGAPPRDTRDPRARPRFRVPATASQAAEELLEAAGVGQRSLAFIAPGSVWPTKRWPARRYGRVADLLVGRGLSPVVLGSAGERALCREVRESAAVPVVDLSGQTSLLTLAALLARGSLLVCNDSGPGHLASAVDCPVVAIFGPTHPSMGYLPLGDRVQVVQQEGLPCRPCHRHGPPACPYHHFECMQGLPIIRVERAIDALLERSPQREAATAREG